MASAWCGVLLWELRAGALGVRVRRRTYTPGTEFLTSGRTRATCWAPFPLGEHIPSFSTLTASVVSESVSLGLS